MIAFADNHNVKITADNSEAGILRDLQAGSEIAYEQLVRMYGGRMLATAKRILSDHGQAEDAVQDAFLLAFRRIGDFEGRSSLGTWLHAIVVNAALGIRRKRHAHHEISMSRLTPDLDAGRSDLVPSSEVTPIHALSRDETVDRVREQIEQLPEHHRAVLKLRDLLELSTQETADRLGVAVGAVRTRLHRARRALRDRLEAQTTETLFAN